MDESLTSQSQPKPKRIRWLRRIILVCLVGGLFYFCAFITVTHIIGATDHAEKADVIIVLGAGIRRDGRPGWAINAQSNTGGRLMETGVCRCYPVYRRASRWLPP